MGNSGKLSGRLRATALGALASLLAGCGADPGLGRGDGVYAPGLARGEGADPLIAGHRLLEAGEAQLALDAYMLAAAQHGLTPDTLAAMGSANLRLGRLGQAEALLRRAVEEDPLFVPAWNNLGVLLMERGKWAEASEVFRRAYAADSGGSDTIRDNLRLALLRMEDPFLLGTGAGGTVDFNDLGGGPTLLGPDGEDAGALSPEAALSEIEPL